MAKCCDRCDQRIDPTETIKIKFVANWSSFVKDIDIAVQRMRDGYDDPSYYHKTVKGTWELCEDCKEQLCEFMLEKRGV